jgi:2-oxoglutarate ferredoxin oxidoreductase subunit alpha
MGGVVPFPDEVLAEIQRLAFEPVHSNGHPRQAWMKRHVLR